MRLFSQKLHQMPRLIAGCQGAVVEERDFPAQLLQHSRKLFATFTGNRTPVDDFHHPKPRQEKLEALLVERDRRQERALAGYHRVSGPRIYTWSKQSGPGEVTFSPNAIRGGEYEFHIGTAGSVTLVLQTIILPLLFAGRPSRVTLTGGTHVPSSPSFHYLSEVFAPMLQSLGGDIRLTINRYGFYPRGGGDIRADIAPTRGLRPLTLTVPGELRRITGCSGVGNLPLGIAERQRSAARLALADQLGDSFPSAEIELVHAPGPGRGTFLFLLAETETALAGFSSLGALGKRAETVGTEVADELCRHLATGAPLDPHLADQLVPILALCPGESSFATSCITRHLLTNLWVISQFRPLRFQVTGEEGTPGEVTIFPGDWPEPA